MTTGNWEVEFYELTSGRCPTHEFLDSLQAKERVFAQRALERLERFGPTLRRPHIDFLRDDIYELRVQTPGGRLRFFYFFFAGRKIVVTHAIKKKTGPVPPAEIDRAIAHRAAYFERNEGG
jgi:phage-related protein